MARKKLTELPPLDVIRAEADPLRRFINLCRWADDCGTLPRAYAVERAIAAKEALDGDSRKQLWLAREADINESSISRILKQLPPEATR